MASPEQLPLPGFTPGEGAGLYEVQIGLLQAIANTFFELLLELEKVFTQLVELVSAFP